MEGDFHVKHSFQLVCHFNPLPPHGGRHVKCYIFSSMVYISIHSLRMEGDSAIVQCALFQHISIHSLRMEGDFTPALILSIASYFNPLPPHGGRRVIFYIYYTTQSISIHSLRMEGDSGGSVLLFMAVVFQSTPSAWRETWNADRKEQE